MAISDTINSLKKHIGNAYTAIGKKKGTVPANKNCKNLQAAIESISTEKEEQTKTVTITENGTQKALPDENKVFTEVTIVTNVPATPTQEVTKDLDMTAGDQIIIPASGYNLSKATVKKPATFVAGNIKKGVDIGGVTGTLETQKEEEAGTATITENGSQTFSPTSGKVFSDFTVTTNVPTGVDISDTTAVANDVRKGKDFYSSDGTKTQGAIENYGGVSLSMSTAVLTKEQYGMGAVAIGDKIYLHGQNKNFEQFDTKTNEHSLLDVVTDSVTYYAPIAAMDKKIYLFGGVIGTRKIVVFNTETNTANEQTLSSTYEYGCSGASVGNKIYLFGSKTFKTGTTINIYNISNNTLSKSSLALPISASGIAACAINDKIYLFGGHNTDTSAGIYGTFLDSITVFDVTNNTILTLGVRLPVGMTNIGVAALGTKIYLFGGGSANEYHNTIYEFDTLTNVIKKLDIELPEKMHGIAAATVNDKIYLFGGQGSSGIKNFIQIFSPKTSVLITSKDGEALPTNGKYCVSDITVQPALEIKTITSNGEALPSESYCGFEKVIVNVQTAPKLQTKTVTPTKLQQNVSPDSGYDGLSGVTVNAIPDNYVIPTGTVNITTNGTHDVSGKASVNVNVPVKEEQTKSVTINANGTVKITPDAGKTLSEVTVITAVESEKPTLNAPTISLSNSTLTITNSATNGNFVTSYRIFNGSAELAVVTSTTVDLSTLLTETGTYSITVKASAPNFNNSAASNAVSYEVAPSGYTITVTADSGTYDFTVYDGQSSSGKLLETFTSGKTADVICSSGYLYFESSAYNGVQSTTGGVTRISDTLCSVSGDGTVNVNFYCLIEGTQITLADGTSKAIEDIDYDDELLVWNFYAGRFDKAKPSWIKVEETAPRYNLVKFSNGSEVGFVGAGGEKGYHRIFNKEAGTFTHTGCKETPNGTTTFAQDGTFPTVVSQEVVEKEVKFYNVITENHYNLFANGILTSCRLSNKYRIEDMRYVGEKLISDEQEKAYFERIESKRK